VLGGEPIISICEVATAGKDRAGSPSSQHGARPLGQHASKAPRRALPRTPA